MFPDCQGADEIATSYPEAKQGPSSVARQTRYLASPSPEIKATILPLISESLEQANFSTSAKNILLSSWHPGTLKQYKSYLKCCEVFWLMRNKAPVNPAIEHIVEFLKASFPIGYSAINTARSALSSIIQSSSNRPIGEHPLIGRLMKGVFELRASFLKYSQVWDIGKLCLSNFTQ